MPCPRPRALLHGMSAMARASPPRGHELAAQAMMPVRQHVIARPLRGRRRDTRLARPDRPWPSVAARSATAPASPARAERSAEGRVRCAQRVLRRPRASRARRRGEAARRAGAARWGHPHRPSRATVRPRTANTRSRRSAWRSAGALLASQTRSSPRPCRSSVKPRDRSAAWSTTSETSHGFRSRCRLRSRARWPRSLRPPLGHPSRRC